MINYLFSWLDKENGFTKEQSKLLKEDIVNNSNITFIASLFDNYERNDKQVSIYIKNFNKIGITFNNVNIIDNRLNCEESKTILENTNIIFLLGGSPELQMKSINEYKLLDSIKKCKLVLGVSAGALNQITRVMYKDDFDNFVMKDYNGLGLVNINIFPHFDLENKTILEEVKEVSNSIPLILLPNDSFIRIKNNNIDIVGKSYKIDKGMFIYNENQEKQRFLTKK